MRDVCCVRFNFDFICEWVRAMPHCADRSLHGALQVMGGDVRFKAMDNLPKLTPAPPQEKKEKK